MPGMFSTELPAMRWHRVRVPARVRSLELHDAKALQISMQHEKTKTIPVRDDKLGLVKWAAISLQVSLS